MVRVSCGQGLMEFLVVTGYVDVRDEHIAMGRQRHATSMVTSLHWLSHQEAIEQTVRGQ